MSKQVKQGLLGRTLVILCIVLIAVAILYTVVSERPTSEPKTLRSDSISILWAEWPPADYLQTLTADFTNLTGIQVDIVQESWTTWQSVFFEEMEKKGQRFDMVIGDSQWLGRGSVGGHYVELTKWMKKNGVDTSMTPASITGYAEFPKGSGHYWAVPVEGDAMGFSYRKDLFESLQEKQAFQAHYGYELAVPKTWHQLRDIAQFFYRPAQDLFGILAWTEPKYDGITMGVDAVVWAWGADLGDPGTYRVKGILNSKAGIDALRFYKSLNQYNNPEWIHHYLDTRSNSNQPMMQGRVAMAMGYFAINPELLDPAKNPYAHVTGFFATPRGPKGRASSLGGQGISIVSYTRKKEACLRFLEWFVRDDVQQKWAQLGGLSCNIKVLNSEQFLNASPINRPFKESMEMVKDFWAVPEYPQLLAASQKYWSEYILEDKYGPEETMDRLARTWEEIFEYARYYKE